MIELSYIIGDGIGLTRAMVEDESIDLVVTDPPYGDNHNYGRGNKAISGNENPLLFCLAIAEFERVLKPDSTAFCFTNWKHYPFLYNYVHRYTEMTVSNCLIWNKNNFGMGQNFRNKYEMIMVIEKGKPVYNSKGFPNVLRGESITHDDSSHPHQKPVDLLVSLIEHASHPGDTVFDPFLGSGSVFRACKKTQRNGIGYEIDRTWEDAIKKNKMEGVKDITSWENDGWGV